MQHGMQEVSTETQEQRSQQQAEAALPALDVQQNAGTIAAQRATQVQAEAQQQLPAQVVAVVVKPQDEPRMGGQQGLAAVTGLLESSAVELEGKGHLAKSLALRLLAAQLLLLILKGNAEEESTIQVADVSEGKLSRQDFPGAAGDEVTVQQTAAHDAQVAQVELYNPQVQHAAVHKARGQQAKPQAAQILSPKQARRALADMYSKVTILIATVMSI